MNESVDRYIYRISCKHYLEPQGLCLAGCFSDLSTGWSLDTLCTENTKCQRMKRYDKNNRNKRHKIRTLTKEDREALSKFNEIIQSDLKINRIIENDADNSI